ncbi:MAG TPA: ABC transporter permease [Kofleriaceae bacterium]|nr:ABC transporter permease [Kofleriaceae bacterium]
MSALGTKLRRDLFRLKGQVLTIAVVLGCGIWAMLMIRSTYESLIDVRDRYYTEYRFGDVFAHAKRVPDHVARRIEALPGVARVESRLVEDVMVPLPDEPDPVTGRIVSIADDGTMPLNALYVRSGRLPAGADEAAILEQFALAHGIVPGDRLPVVMNGQLRQIRVVGIAMSPEYVLAISGNAFMVDNRAFVVMWMQRGAVAPTYRLEGAFDDITLQLEPQASVPEVLAAVDRELAPYGGFHAVPRERQMSNYALTGELDNLRNLAVVIPAIFLAVAAFLVNVVVSRLVFLERNQIAVLKALGYSDRRIALHYLGLVTAIVGIAAVIGIAAGDRSGRWMTELYASFYKFPYAMHRMSPTVIAYTLAIGLGSAVTGALGAVRRVAKMPPAEAMRPPTPLSYRRTIVERLHLNHFVGPAAMMVVREINRRPLRFLMSTAGIAMAVAIFIFGKFSWDSFDYLMSEVWLRSNRQDMIVTLAQAEPARAVKELEAIPGVQLAEGERVVPVRMHAGSRWRDVPVFGYPAKPALHTLLDRGETAVVLPADGVVITDRLAHILGLRVGDEVEVEILEGDWPTRTIRIAGLVDEPFGLQAHARIDWLDHLLRTEPRVTTINLRVSPGRIDDVRARLKQYPAVRGVTSTQRVIDNYRSQTGESMLVMTMILGISGAAIAIGVVYNNARIALSLRARDLASLRVLGFTRREISAVLLGELGAQVVAGVPLGLLLGWWWARMYAATIEEELMNFPLHISSGTYAVAATIAMVAGLVSALLVRKKLDRLDLVAVLKSSE